MGAVGDSFDRFLVRVGEMRQSVNILKQCLNLIPKGPIKAQFEQSVVSCKKNIKNSMESLINFFKNYSSGFFVPKGSLYSAIESPKGEFGVYLTCNALNSPYRCKIRAPGFFHLQGIKFLAKNTFLADVVALIGTFDIVFGEIDR